MLLKAFNTCARQTAMQVKYCFASKTITVKIPAIETYKLEKEKLPTETQTTSEELLQAYYNMTLIRKMEIACDTSYKAREMRGFCHLYDGQEAVIEGIEGALTLQDYMITAYRCHGHAIKRGTDPHGVIAEMMQKRTGATKGKGGSMHFYNKEKNFYGGHGIVGAQLALGTGLAFALKYENKQNVAIAMYGDGSANQGQFFEAMNMAKLWSLPVIYVCENNRYGMGTSVQRAAQNPKLYERGDQIPGLHVDGCNYLAVRAAFQWAKKFSINNGPLLVECDTYRYHGHSMSDPGLSYRTREEVQQMRQQRDCINQVKKLILENNFATEDQLADTDAKIKEIIDKALENARKESMPGPEDLLKDTYVDTASHYIRNIEYENSQFPEGKAY